MSVIRDDNVTVKTKGEAMEGIAFTFCKAATIILFINALGGGRFVLPIAAGATAIFYLLAHFFGQRDTRCVLRWPILIAVFWGTISALSLYVLLRP